MSCYILIVFRLFYYLYRSVIRSLNQMIGEFTETFTNLGVGSPLRLLSSCWLGCALLAWQLQEFPFEKWEPTGFANSGYPVSL